eukprot:SAG31_NODE_888_length_11219_cov_5.584712_11_plen_97_part_00
MLGFVQVKSVSVDPAALPGAVAETDLASPPFRRNTLRRQHTAVVLPDLPPGERDPDDWEQIRLDSNAIEARIEHMESHLRNGISELETRLDLHQAV